jgi:hypothetical protein
MRREPGRWRWARGGCLAAAALALAPCAYDEGLVPAPAARMIPSAPQVAYDQKQGLELQVNGDAWHRDPPDLEKVMTPIAVTVRNRSSRPVRISYQDFALETPQGARLNPLPPFAIRTVGPTRTSPVTAPWFAYDRFYVAPYYGMYYPNMRPWRRWYP